MNKIPSILVNVKSVEHFQTGNKCVCLNASNVLLL